MEKRIGYDIQILVKRLFPCYIFKQIQTEYDSEEHYSEKRHWYIAYPEINRVKFYDGCFSTSQYLFSDKGEEIKAQSSNVNVDDLTIPRINKLKQISPILTMIDDQYAEITKELEDWIQLYAIQENNMEDFLEAISKEFYIDAIIEYQGCPNPSKHGSCWSYSSNPLVMTASNQQKVLDGIDDELIRKQVECLFYHFGKKKYKI